VWARGYGVADTASAAPVTEDTVFQATSISKPVTAWGVMKLVETGKLDLEASVEQYLTRWHLPPSQFDHRGVTIRRILSHTAGLSLHDYPGLSPDQPLAAAAS
jgi:CubicO group peptidase (beta-lactamase class C family)